MLKVTVVKDVPNAVLHLEGELDMSTGDVLTEAVQGFDLDMLKTITFLVSGLDLIDSTGIGQLIGYHKQLSQRNGRIYIENNNHEIEEIFELIGVREIVNS